MSWQCTTPEWYGATEAPVNPQQISILPLNPEKHDRASFSCGIARLDNFLKRSARKHQAADFTRVWVATEDGRDKILGYYALNAHSLEGEDFPSSLTKHAPRSGSIPAVYLSMIAVDRRYQGCGIGSILLGNVLKRAQDAANQIGLKAVVLDVIEDGGPDMTEKRQAFYQAMGFQPLPTRSLRMFISIDTLRNSWAKTIRDDTVGPAPRAKDQIVEIIRRKYKR